VTLYRPCTRHNPDRDFRITVRQNPTKVWEPFRSQREARGSVPCIKPIIVRQASQTPAFSASSDLIYPSLRPLFLEGSFTIPENGSLTTLIHTFDLLNHCFAMASPQPIRLKPLNPLIDEEQVSVSLDVINESSRNDPMTAKKALLDETRVKSSTNDRESRVISGITGFGWGWELLAWVTALISLVAIFGILVAFDHKPLPQWPHSITLNTIIAIFSQISATALSIPLSECISQLKWLWFTRRNRPLYDFDTFDKASRGPWSSLVLIWKTNARSI
jgi:hypothetical protein